MAASPPREELERALNQWLQHRILILRECVRAPTGVLEYDGEGGLAAKLAGAGHLAPGTPAEDCSLWFRRASVSGDQVVVEAEKVRMQPGRKRRTYLASRKRMDVIRVVIQFSEAPDLARAKRALAGIFLTSEEVEATGRGKRDGP
jgi:hypothetical protein